MNRTANVRRLNAFLSRYADACDARGDHVKAARVRCEMVPELPFLLR